MILLYKMPGRKSRKDTKKIDKKKNNKDKKQTDFVQREREMNQAPGGRLDVKVH